MTDRAAIERPARVALMAYAAWSAVLAVSGRPGPFFPAEARLAAGAILSGACVAAAVRPTTQRIEWALFAASGYALWSAARVLAADYDSAVSIAGAVSYATLSVMALVVASMTAVLAGIEQAVKVHEADE